jgi:uncharacterized membrane protein
VDSIPTMVLISATLTTGLIAGVFYSFACSVMLGLGKADDRTFIDAMQRINEAILNGWFLLSFGGAWVLTIVAGLLYRRIDPHSALGWIVAAFALYTLMIVITAFINVPLNDKLAAAGAPEQITDLTRVRDAFEGTWVMWNIVRAVACTAAFGCLCWALVLQGQIRSLTGR